MSNSTKLWGGLICIFFMASGCSKDVAPEPQFNEQSLRANGTRVTAATSKQLKMTAKTWYRISPTNLSEVPGLANQKTFANVPGAGSGTATNMGNVGIWLNQRAFSPDGQNPIAGIIAAPLTEISTYNSLESRGAPLPALQPEDLHPFNTLMHWLQIPATVSGNVVWSVVYNVKGDALFLSSNTPSIAVQESATRVTYSGEGIFVGGRGLYANASGTYQITGYLNPQDANDAGFSINGELFY